MKAVIRWLCGVFILFASSGADLEARSRSFVAGQKVRMAVEVPAGYSFKNETTPGGLTRVVMENPVWRISIVCLISAEYSAASEGEDWQRNLLVAQSADILAQSKEQDYQFRALNPRRGSGVYCIFTDPEAQSVEDLKPDEFMHAVVGAKVIPGAVMYFQIFCNDIRTPEFQEAFNLFVNGFDGA